jgi:catechol 2,3-dioxygenase
LLRAQNMEVRLVGTADHTVSHSLYLLDPDGNEVELYVDVPGIDWKDPSWLDEPIRGLRL